MQLSQRARGFVDELPAADADGRGGRSVASPRLSRPSRGEDGGCSAEQAGGLRAIRGAFATSDADGEATRYSHARGIIHKKEV